MVVRETGTGRYFCSCWLGEGGGARVKDEERSGSGGGSFCQVSLGYALAWMFRIVLCFTTEVSFGTGTHNVFEDNKAYSFCLIIIHIFSIISFM